ncbi:MAG TPA: hypothetical protein VE197_12125, partial [Mycobacterium sp.]|nr:hypothetical protein [Mycobacterium sp.]
VAFLGWAGNHFAAGETFYLIVGSSAEGSAVTQWGLFQLAPHLETETQDAADWLVIYDANIAGHPSRAFGSPDVYAPGFAVARNRHAG